MQSLSALQAWNVLVRPHPRLTKTETDALRRFGCTITLKDTATLVPKCDLYVTSVSATIRWAIACGKPVVNYDVYQYGYQEYSDAGGVLTLDNKKDFTDTLKRLTADQVYYERIAAAQREASSHWGQLDGNSSKRLMEFFENVISANKGQDY
jgi:glycosyltransferase involved in cell wall biosynthesis